MIVVEPSALLAVALDEPTAPACGECLASHTDIAISAGTWAEAQIVAERRGVRPSVHRLVEGLGMEVVPVTAAFARAVADAYAAWGKGVHPAGLNFGDCFAYALAVARACPLLYVGDDFSRTDLRSALADRG